jgi:hypothetical protein
MPHEKSFGSDGDYFKWVEDWSSRFATELDINDITIDCSREIMTKFIKTAYDAGLTSGEIVDFFCVSSDSVSDRLKSLDGIEKQMLIAIFDDVNSRTFNMYFEAH